MEQFAGRDVALQVLTTIVISRLANDSPDPAAYVAAMRQEALTAANGLQIGGDNVDEVRAVALNIINEVFRLLIPAPIVR